MLLKTYVLHNLFVKAEVKLKLIKIDRLFHNTWKASVTKNVYDLNMNSICEKCFYLIENILCERKLFLKQNFKIILSLFPHYIESMRIDNVSMEITR